MLKNPKVSKFMFVFANVLLIFAMNQRFDEPLAFACAAIGLVTISFFLMRAIEQVVG